MSSKLNNLLGMKAKRAVAMVITGAMLYAFSGCSNSETSSSITQNSSSNQQSTSADKSEITQPAGQSEFKFDEAIKNITVFGYNISLPYAIKDLEECFSLGEESSWLEIEDVISSDLYYEGKKIGIVYLSDDRKQITGFALGFLNGYHNQIADEELRKAMYDRYGWYSGEIEMDFHGLSFKSSANDIKDCLGNPKETTDEYFNDYLVYEYPNGHIWIQFSESNVITNFVINLS